MQRVSGALRGGGPDGSLSIGGGEVGHYCTMLCYTTLHYATLHYTDIFHSPPSLILSFIVIPNIDKCQLVQGLQRFYKGSLRVQTYNYQEIIQMILYKSLSVFFSLTVGMFAKLFYEAPLLVPKGLLPC